MWDRAVLESTAFDALCHCEEPRQRDAAIPRRAARVAHDQSRDAKGAKEKQKQDAKENVKDANWRCHRYRRRRYRDDGMRLLGVLGLSFASLLLAFASFAFLLFGF